MIYIPESTKSAKPEPPRISDPKPTVEAQTESKTRDDPKKVVVVIPTALVVWDKYTKNFVRSFVDADIPVCLVIHRARVNNVQLDMVRREFPSGVIFIFNEKKDFNFSYANNLGRAQMESLYPEVEWVIYANDDMLFNDASSVNLLKNFSPPKEYCNHTVFSGVILNMDGSVQRCGGRLTEGGPQTLPVVPSKPTHYQLMGGPFHIARAYLKWDENLPIHLNDDDFSLSAGGTVVIPSIKVKHHMNSTTGSGSFVTPQRVQYFKRKHIDEYMDVLSDLRQPQNVEYIVPPHVDDIDQVVILQTDHIGDHAFTYDARMKVLYEFFMKRGKPIVMIGGGFIEGILKDYFGAAFSNSNLFTFLPIDYRDDGGCKANIHPVRQEQINKIKEVVSHNSLLINFRCDGSDRPLFNLIPHKYLCSFTQGEYALQFNPKIPVTISNNILTALIPEYISLHDNYYSGGIEGVVINPFTSIPPKEPPLSLFEQFANKLKDEFGLKVFWAAHKQDRNRLRNITADILPDLSIFDLMMSVADKKLWYVGCDSGPTHWAVRSGIPTLCIHPSQTNPVMLSVPSMHLLFIHPKRGWGDLSPPVLMKGLGMLHKNVKIKISVNPSIL